MIQSSVSDFSQKQDMEGHLAAALKKIPIQGALQLINE